MSDNQGKNQDNTLTEVEKNAVNEQLEKQLVETLLGDLYSQINKLSKQIKSKKGNEITDKDKENFEEEINKIKGNIGLTIKSLNNLQNEDRMKTYIGQLENSRNIIKETQQKHKDNEITDNFAYSNINLNFTNILQTITNINAIISPETAYKEFDALLDKQPATNTTQEQEQKEEEEKKQKEEAEKRQKEEEEKKGQPKEQPAPKDVTPKTPTPEVASENVTPETSSAFTSITDILNNAKAFKERAEKTKAEEETRKKEEIVLKQVIQILSGKEITDENGKKVEANKVSFYTDTMPQNEKILDTIWIPTINHIFEEKVGIITLKLSKIKEIGETIRKNIQIAEKEGFKIPEDQKKKIEDAITKKEEEHIKKTYESVKFKISLLVPEGNLDKLDETKKGQITEIFYRYDIKDEKQIDRFIKEVNAEKNRERAAENRQKVAEELRKTLNERNNARKNNVADNQQTNAKTVGPQQQIDTVQQPKQADTQQPAPQSGPTNNAPEQTDTSSKTTSNAAPADAGDATQQASATINPQPAETQPQSIPSAASHGTSINLEDNLNYYNRVENDLQKGSKEIETKIKKLKEDGDFEKSLMSLTEEGNYDAINEEIETYIEKIKEDNGLTGINVNQVTEVIAALDGGNAKTEQEADKAVKNATEKLNRLNNVIIPRLKIKNLDKNTENSQTEKEEEIKKFIEQIRGVLNTLENNKLLSEEQKKNLTDTIKLVEVYKQKEDEDARKLTKEINALTHDEADKKERSLVMQQNIAYHAFLMAQDTLNIAKAVQIAIEKKEELSKSNELLENNGLANIKNGKKATKNALKALERIKNLNEVNKLTDTLKEEQKILTTTQKRVDQPLIDTFVPGLVNKLTRNQWSDNSKEDTTLRKQFEQLNNENQKALLKSALQTIFAENEKGKNDYRQQLLEKISAETIQDNEEDKKKAIDSLINNINNTVERCFENKYKGRLFAKEQSLSLIGVITNDMVDTFKIEQYEVKQAQQQTNFQKLVIDRTNEFQNIFEKEGAAKCRDFYENNLDNKEEHELDVLALNRLPGGVYNEITGNFFIRLFDGTSKQILNDQEKVNGDTIKSLLSEKNIFNRAKKPKNIKAYKIAQSIIENPNSENTRKALKFLCQQQDRSEAWPKSKGKWHGNMLNAVVQQLEKNTFKDVAILKDAFQEIVNDKAQGFSITEPMEDKMVYFKIVYTYATEDAKNELLRNEEFKKQVGALSEATKEKLGYFFELIGEGENEGIKRLNLQQQKPTKNRPLNEDEKVDYVLKHGFGVKVTQKSASNEETLTPYYLFDANGNSNKNNENLLGKVNFKLQDSFLGLTCAKDIEAFALANNTRAKKVRDENGNKIKDKNQRVTGEQVKQQRAAEKAAQEAVKRAGGNLKTITEKTMPLLKNTEFNFTINGEEVTLGEAVKVCLKALRKKQQREQTLGILQGKIPEKSLMEQVGDMLHLNVEDGYFSGKELQSIREAISAQIIATQAFSEEFKNQTQTNDGNEKGQGLENQRTTEQAHTNNIQEFNSGLSREAQEAMAILNLKANLNPSIKKQIEEQIIDAQKPNGDISPVATEKNQTRIGEERQTKDGQEADSRSPSPAKESPTNNEDTRQKIGQNFFNQGGLDSETQRQKAAAQPTPKKQQTQQRTQERVRNDF